MAAPELIAVFDTETSGISLENDRIVTAWIGTMTPDGEIQESWSWMINPGVEIPQGAIDVHGITNEMAREGQPALDAIYEIVQRLNILDRANIPVVAYNARYDLTILDREVQRHWPTLRFTAPRVVLDPYVMWKKLDRYKKGGRKLIDAAAAFGVPVDSTKLHDASYDCIMTGRVLYKMLDHQWLKDLDVATISRRTIKHAADQAESLEQYFNLKQDKEWKQAGKPQPKPAPIVIEGEWPMISRKVTETK